MSQRPAVLLVEDDARLGAMVVEYLEKNEFSVTLAKSGEAGLRALLAPGAGFDAMLLDLMLPGIDGLEVCRRVRAADGPVARVPVLMLTARGDDVDKIVGLELGADDYLAKPFNPRELLARLRAVLRRTRAASGGSGGTGARLRAGGVELDPDAREVRRDGKRVALTSFEFQLLATLLRARGRVLSREFLMDALKGEAFESFDRSIDVHISKLRAKLEADPRDPRYIKTVRGAGYVFASEDDTDTEGEG